MPPELRWGEGYSYAGLDDSDIIADKWEGSNRSVYIEADVSKFTAAPGVYTLILWSDEEEPRPLSAYPIFKNR